MRSGGSPQQKSLLRVDLFAPDKIISLPSPYVDLSAPVCMVAPSFFFWIFSFFFNARASEKVHASWLMIYGGIYMIAHVQLGNFDLMGSNESAFETPTHITLLHRPIWMPLFLPSLNILQSLRTVDAVDEEEVVESMPSE